MLQNNPIVAKIRKGLITRVLNELKKRATKEPDLYAGFWEAFGPLIKEGLYESFETDPTFCHFLDVIQLMVKV